MRSVQFLRQPLLPLRLVRRLVCTAHLCRRLVLPGQFVRHLVLLPQLSRPSVRPPHSSPPPSAAWLDSIQPCFSIIGLTPPAPAALERTCCAPPHPQPPRAVRVLESVPGAPVSVAARYGMEPKKIITACAFPSRDQAPHVIHFVRPASSAQLRCATVPLLAMKLSLQQLSPPPLRTPP